MATFGTFLQIVELCLFVSSENIVYFFYILNPAFQEFIRIKEKHAVICFNEGMDVL